MRRPVHFVLSLALTAAIFTALLWRIPFERLLAALAAADHAPFFALMMVNTIFYFCWDTLVLARVVRWFHAPVAWRELLPVRAASYVVGFFNTNVGRGALAAYLSRRLGAPFLQLGSTVLFMVLTEYTHLVAWATVGIVGFGFRSERTRELLWVPPAVAVFWLVFLKLTRLPRRDWDLLRTFRIAPLARYVQIVLLRAPMFFVSLCIHYAAARTFGITIPFGALVMFLPVIFMIAALPITVGHLGTTQAAWIFFFGAYAPPAHLLAFSLAAHLTFTATRALLGLAFLPRAYADLVAKPQPL
jgi:hypothetical protein